MSMQTLATFLGWCTVINFVILAVAAIAMVTMRGTMVTRTARSALPAKPMTSAPALSPQMFRTPPT